MENKQKMGSLAYNKKFVELLNDKMQNEPDLMKFTAKAVIKMVMATVTDVSESRGGRGGLNINYTNKQKPKVVNGIELIEAVDKVNNKGDMPIGYSAHFSHAIQLDDGVNKQLISHNVDGMEKEVYPWENKNATFVAERLNNPDWRPQWARNNAGAGKPPRWYTPLDRCSDNAKNYNLNVTNPCLMKKLFIECFEEMKVIEEKFVQEQTQKPKLKKSAWTKIKEAVLPGTSEKVWD